MENSLFTGQMLLSATALLGLGGVLVSLGKLIQKVDQLHKDLDTLKTDCSGLVFLDSYLTKVMGFASAASA